MTKKRTNAKSGSQKKIQNSGSPMDTGLLEQIIKLMAANDLNTVDLRDGDKRMILRRGAVSVPMQMSAPAATSSPVPASVAKAPEKPAEETDLIAIKSPMVGTFYSSPSPDARAFVTVGSTVSEESDVCIIEAMKVFNNIKAECRGTIAKILVTNGQTVEFGQTLFLVKP